MGRLSVIVSGWTQQRLLEVQLPELWGKGILEVTQFKVISLSEKVNFYNYFSGLAGSMFTGEYTAYTECKYL